MAEVGSKSCGCKGIRSCLLCESGKIDTPVKSPDTETKDIERYLYCAQCEKAWLDNATTHPDHTGEAIDFPGIAIIPEFVTTEEEENIVSEIDRTTWAISQSGRRKQDYGPKVNFKKKKLRLACFTGLPPFSEQLMQRLTHCACPVLTDFRPVELCNLEYLPDRGSSIDPHFDDFWLWGDRLVTLNLLSDTFLTMSCSSRLGVEVAVPMPARSLVVVHGPARHVWQHGIYRQDITGRRLAVTLRELTPEFNEDGPRADLGRELLEIASNFNGTAVGS